MKKFLFLIASLFASVLFFSCKPETTFDESTKIYATQGNDISNSSETEDTFLHTVTQDYEYGFSTRTDLSMEDGFIKIKNTDGSKSSTIHNWVLSQNYVTLSGTGFQASIKMNDEMNFCAIEMFKKNGSYDYIDFQIRSTGEFQITQENKKILTVAADSSHIDLSKFNLIKVRTCDSGKIEVYVNGFLLKVFESKELSFSLKDTEKVAVAYQVKKSASNSSPAKAWIRLDELQIVKK